MRSPHNPQSAVHLGDDPDLAAEIGSRLAASSQTAQGLLTNYLFYGQRHAAQSGELQTEAEAQAHVDDRLRQQRDVPAEERAAQALRSQRTGPRNGRAAGGESEQAGGRSRSGSGSDSRKLRLIQSRQTRESAAGAVSKAADSPSPDALAADPLTGDPLARDLLSTPAEPVPDTAPRQPPIPRLQ